MFEITDSVSRLTRDLRSSAVTLGADEARFLVDTYYAMQKQRIRDANQSRALSGDAEPHAVLDWLMEQHSVLENQVKRALGAYAEGSVIGQWMLAVRGIGPVISAGLLAHIDITQCPTVGHIWSFAGLDPSREWGKGEKRPWNASLKTLCWKLGESFVKTKGHEEAVYGAIYDQRKEYEANKNAAMEYRDQAEEILRRRPKHAQAATYKIGKLPDGHIHMRAKRYAVKQFLADLHAFWYEHEYDKKPPLPYPIAHMNHVHLRQGSGENQ